MTTHNSDSRLPPAPSHASDPERPAAPAPALQYGHEIDSSAPRPSIRVSRGRLHQRAAPRRRSAGRPCVPLPWSCRRQPRRVDRGCAGRSVDLLRRRRVGRRVEDDGRRHSLDPRVRQHAGDGDRRARRRPLRSEHRLGRHRGSVGDSRQRRDRRRHLQVDGRRQDVGPHGPRRDRTHRPHPRPPDQPRRRVCVRDRAHHRAAAGARRVPYDRRRPALGACVVRRREHRLLRAVDGHEEPAHDLGRHVAGRDAPVGDAERWRRQRHLQVDGQRYYMDPTGPCPERVAHPSTGSG